MHMADFKSEPMYRYLLILTLCATGGVQAWRTLFDNFAVNIIHLDGYHVGILQSLREVPGFLALLVVYVLLFIREHKLAATSVLIMAIGIALTGFFPSFYGVIFTTLLMSFGFHYFETANQSLTLQYFTQQEAPLVFGKLRSISAACNVGIGVFFLLFAPLLNYTSMYLIIAAVIILAVLWAMQYNPTKRDLPLQRKEMVFRKRYWLFYLLTFFSGARRQIFMAFAVFLLVKKFNFTIQEIAALFLLNNFVNYFLSPFIGKCIVKYGERKVLSLEYFSLILVFCGYAVVEDKYLAGLLYVADHIFFNSSIAIKTFFQKICDPADIAPSMAVGFTINHIAAVILPTVGGLLWLVDYRIPFLLGAFLCILSFISAQFVSSQILKTQHDSQ